jgi:hypothetical protein
LYNILMEFGIPPSTPTSRRGSTSKEEFGVPIELVRLIKVYLKFKLIVESG